MSHPKKAKDDSVPVTAEQYRDLRQKIGTQAAVADRLDVQVLTIKRREKASVRVTVEAWRALRDLARESGVL